MASTNKTANYDLSQYVGTDKPTYLGDYNSDMNKIDTQMKANNDLANGANATATTASANASTALNEAESANATAEAGLSLATELQDYINLVNFQQITDINISAGKLNNPSLRIATNKDNSMFKIYGRIQVVTFELDSLEEIIVSFKTSLRPNEKIIINGGVTTFLQSRLLLTGTPNQYTGNIEIYPLYGVYDKDIEIDTDGTITIKTNVQPTGHKVHSVTIVIPPCLYFLKSFGDTPTPAPQIVE